MTPPINKLMTRCGRGLFNTGEKQAANIAHAKNQTNDAVNPPAVNHGRS